MPALTALLDGATATLASRAPLQLAAEEPLRLAIEALDDVATYSTGQPGGQGIGGWLARGMLTCR